MPEKISFNSEVFDKLRKLLEENGFKTKINLEGEVVFSKSNLHENFSTPNEYKATELGAKDPSLGVDMVIKVRFTSRWGEIKHESD